MKKLIVITTPRFFSGENEVLTHLFDEGMQRLHIRKPESSVEEIRNLLDTITSGYHSRIVLHDHFELASEYILGGIHLNSRNDQIPQGFTGSISRSCHSLEELIRYKDLDYLFLSPIFQSISKEGYGSGFPLETLQQASDTGIINEKVIALSGVDLSTWALLKTINFGGAAVLGALWKDKISLNEQDSIIAQFKKLQTWI